MDQVAWDMRYGLPNQVYLEFVARYLIRLAPGQPLVDPFSLDIPEEKLKDAYVERLDVEREIIRPGTKIVLGAQGSGKTSLFRKLSASRASQTLVVRLPLGQAGTGASRQELMEGKLSFLAPELFTRLVFGAFWEDLFLNPINRERFLPQFRPNEAWMTTLRWFYQRYTPVRAEFVGDFELMTWLRASAEFELFGPNSSPEDLLRELLSFVTSAALPERRFGALRPQPYLSVLVMIDDTERLSNQAFGRLLEDAQELHDLNLGNLEFIVFANSSCEKQIRTEMDSIRHGRVMMVRLPPWQPQDLKRLLSRRLELWSQGEFQQAGVSWTHLLPASSLKTVAHMRVEELIVDETISRCKRQAEKSGESLDLDAPCHALRLARGLVSGCAGCWKAHQYSPPLDSGQLEAIVAHYWDAE